MTVIPRQFLTDLYRAAVARADPGQLIPSHCLDRPAGRTVLVGVGKASAGMAAAFVHAWHERGNGPIEGLVVTPRGQAVNCPGIRMIEASHPVPDASSEAGAREMLKLVEGLTEDDLVVSLISGGGSSLLSLAPDAVGQEEKRKLNRALLASGASIHEVNVVRKHFSRVKGGRIAAAAHPARVVTLVLSDIPGDDPALVASGPTIPSASTREDAKEIVARYGIELSGRARAFLDSPEADAPHPDNADFARDEVHLIATARHSLEAARSPAVENGVNAVILSDRIEGEAREAGRFHGALVRETLEQGLFPRPCVLLSGGETTVTIRAKGGRGGRNTEFLLGLVEAIDGVEGVFAIAADTDGIDGTEDNAGAFCDGTSALRLRRTGRPAADYLACNDAYGAFERLGDLFVTGPTGTNVNDFRAILIL